MREMKKKFVLSIVVFQANIVLIILLEMNLIKFIIVDHLALIFMFPNSTTKWHLLVPICGGLVFGDFIELY